VLEENPCMVKLANSWVIMNPGGGPTPDKPDISVVDWLELQPARRAGGAAKASGRPTTRCATPNASSPSKPNAPTNAPSKTANKSRR
jgi:hypothetical protein